MRPDALLAYQLTPGSAVLLALGAGAGAAVLVYLVCRFALGWGSAAKVDDDSPVLDPRGNVAVDEADPFIKGSKMDRRAALRRGGNPIAVLISDADSKAKPSFGYVLDRSTGGLCLSVAAPIPEGTFLTVRTNNAPQTVPWIKVEVRNCRSVGDKEWELGCKFDKTPPWSVLLLFG
ncbi:MAG: PilZ domain-containing protein [Planctomycetia bacterium]|nr:PilZ domain-containing protein [Planctomycetia bacterium]